MPFEEIVARILPILNLDEMQEKLEQQIFEVKQDFAELIQEESQQNQEMIQEEIESSKQIITEEYQEYVRRFKLMNYRQRIK